MAINSSLALKPVPMVNSC